MCAHATVAGASQEVGILRLGGLSSTPVILTCRFPLPIGPVQSRGRRCLLVWWVNCFTGWGGIAACPMRVSPFAARLECSGLKGTEYTGCIEWKKSVFANEMASFLSCSGILLSCGKEQKRKKWKAAALRQKGRLKGVMTRERSENCIKKLKWDEPVCLDLLEFQKKWCGGEREMGAGVGVMEMARFAQECGILVAYQMMTSLTGLKDPFNASVPKIVKSLMREATAETVHSKEDEIQKVVGGIHLKPVAGFFAGGVVVLDIESMHPGIAVSEGICPTGKGVFAGILAGLLGHKRRYSKRPDLARRVLTRVVKRLMVSMTGWLGIKPEEGGTHARRKCYSNILAVSREIMTDLISFCEELFASEPYVGARIVYGVTDSLFIDALGGQTTKLVDDLHERLLTPRFGGHIILKQERTFHTLLLVKCGVYCGYDSCGKFKQVGLRRKTQHPIESEVVELFYRVALAPSVIISTIPMAALEQLLTERPQWIFTLDLLIKRVELLCKGGPAPPGLSALAALPRPSPRGRGTTKRSLDVFLNTMGGLRTK